MNICRLCLFEGNEKQVLSIWENEIENLPTKIANCVSIIISKDDNLPNYACLSCIEQVTQWEMFRNMCQKSNEVLLKEIQLTIQHKEENLNVVKVILNNEQRSTLIEDQVILDKTESESEDFKDDVYFENEFMDFSFKADLVQNVYQCDICSMEIDNCFEYLDHQDSHNGELVFQCSKCSDVFCSRQELLEHDKNHRTICPTCGKQILKSSMALHLIKHTDRFKCDQCGGRFNSNAALSQHVITVHTDIKDHICEMCGKRFSSQTAMRVHMKSHSDERLYPCKLCNYAGRTASAIYVHMSTHANDLCVCEICSKTFKSTRNLNDHLRRVHTKEKKHKCSYCDKKFVDRYMLSIHIRCHTGVRPYQCSYCEKSFIRSDGLKEHIAIHGQRVYHDCKLCGKKFTSKRGLTRHSCVSVM